MPAEPRRDHLVDVALRLFYTHGFHATGIDRILAESGVAKMTLYKHFRSKDDLILAVLEKRDEAFRTWLTGAMDRASNDPKERMLAMFDALDDWFNGRAQEALGFHGCAFIKAACEFDELDHPAHVASAQHKQLIVDYLTGLAQEAGFADPSHLAEQLALLKEGAIVTAQVRGFSEAAQQAKEIAILIMNSALPTVFDRRSKNQGPLQPNSVLKRRKPAFQENELYRRSVLLHEPARCGTDMRFMWQPGFAY